MNIQELATPALLLDIDTFESNLSHMAGQVSSAGKTIRPHAKAHKCVEIARRQIAAGATGVCVATVSEAELMVGAGIPNVLLTSPIADPLKSERVAALSNNRAVVADQPEQVHMHSEAARRAGSSLSLLVDLDVGDHRTGIAPGPAARQLVERILATPGVVFHGLQAYSVRASHLHETDGRAEYSASSLQHALETKLLLESQGIEVPMVTGGSTGSYRADATLAYITELQAGSYALMDVAYARIGGIDFGHALTVLATVVSANHADRVTVDAGFKAFSTDRPFGPEPWDLPGARYDWAGDEFGFVFLDQAARRVKLGDRLRFIPPHCDPTVNLYDRIHVCRGDEVVEVWPVMNRIPSQQPTHV